MCYQIQMRAFLVILMDTQFYNGKHNAYEDYPIGDVLHMVGLANLQRRNDEGFFKFFFLIFKKLIF